MPAQINSNQINFKDRENENEKEIQALNQRYNEFSEKIKELRKEFDEEINKILEEIKKRKIQEIKEQIKSLMEKK